MKVKAYSIIASLVFFSSLASAATTTITIDTPSNAQVKIDTHAQKDWSINHNGNTTVLAAKDNAQKDWSINHNGNTTVLAAKDK